MGEFAGFEGPMKPATEARDLSREQAVERGRLLGEDEANRRGEVGDDRKDRVARAMAYAAWDHDGRPLSSMEHRKEFGVTEPGTVGSLERTLSSRLLQKPKS